MAAAIKALNARIRSNPYTDYFCSTHFWGPASNFGIPLAAIADMKKDPAIISGNMTLALGCYSAVFMRYAFAVTPANYLLFACHAINFTSQVTQGYRYVNYNYGGGIKNKSIEEKTAAMATDAKDSVQKNLAEAKDKVQETAQKIVK